MRNLFREAGCMTHGSTSGGQHCQKNSRIFMLKIPQSFPLQKTIHLSICLGNREKLIFFFSWTKRLYIYKPNSWYIITNVNVINTLLRYKIIKREKKHMENQCIQYEYICIKDKIEYSHHL